MTKCASGLVMAAVLVWVPAAWGAEQARTATKGRAPDQLLAVKEVQTATIGRRVRAAERLTKADVAAALGVHVSSLLMPTVLTPAQLKVQNGRMEFYCAAEVLPGAGYARIVKSTCQGFGMAGIFFEVLAGQTYLIDCAVRPGNTTWELRRWGGASTQTVSNTEHPLFVFPAEASGMVGFSLQATANEFFVHGCEITAAK